MGDTPVKKFVTAVATLVLVAILPMAGPASAAPIDPFVGHWVGMGITENGAPAESVGLIDRELEVTIEETTNGFNVTWVTRRPSKGNKIKHSSISVPFASVNKRGIYRMTDTAEPLSGSPYIWARVADRVMEVHSITPI
jgi:hypothetical protein